jgi:beta-mannosidase
MVWLELTVEGKSVSSNFISLARPKHLDLIRPDTKAAVGGEKEGSATVTLTAKAPVLWVWLELQGLDARFSDNFFHMLPGKPVTVAIETSKAVSLSEISKNLRVRSLVDT